MRVHELIAALKALPQNHEVVTDQHSEYALVEGVFLMPLYENGGFFSRPYSDTNKLRSHGYVYVGVQEEE